MKAAIWVIAAALIVRLAFAGLTGLELDEAYMVAAADRFDASYFDHPPVAWWLELAARGVSGSVAPFVVRLPFVALSGVTSWLVFIITRRLFDVRAGFWAVMAYTVSPVFSVLAGCWVRPDGPVDAALAALVYALIRALGLGGAKPAPRWWLLAGVFAGLALDSKYNAVLVIAGAGIGILSAPGLRGEVWRWQVAAAGMVMLVMIAPVLWWNAGHGWISFHYQGGRLAGAHLRVFRPLVVCAGEALFALPWIWLAMMAALVRALRAGPMQAGPWVLAWAGLVPALLFPAISLWSSTHVLFHWAAPGELMLLPLLGVWLRDISPWVRDKVAVGSAVLLGVAMLLLASEAQFGVIPDIGRFSQPGHSPLLRVIDWTSIAPQIPAGVDVVIAQRWNDAGEVGYALAQAGVKIPVTVVAGEIHEFKFSAPPSAFVGKTALVLALPWTMAQTASFCARFFKSFTPGPVLTVVFHGQVLLAIPTYIGRDMISTPVPRADSDGITAF